MTFPVNPAGKFLSTGQFEGTTGTNSQLPKIAAKRAYLHAHPDNGGTVWVGTPTGIATTPLNDYGYPITVNDSHLVLEGITNLNLVWVFIEQAGDKICWSILSDSAYPYGKDSDDIR